MSIGEIIGAIGGGSILIVILGLIKVKPLEISVWSWIFRKIGKAFNGETLDYVKSIQKTLDEHLQQHDKSQAENNRERILRFADEIYDGKKHSKESYDDIIDVMRDYDKYCEDHKDFLNGRTHAASEIIDSTYKKLFTEHKFVEGRA